MRRRKAIYLLASIIALAGARQSFAQQKLESGRYALTVEGYANITAGVSDGLTHDTDASDTFRADLAVRALGQIKLENGPDLGIRVVAESSPEDGPNLAEASLLLFGGGGRLEIGSRQGLPDVLTGYAPNNFSFTGAEFGPASGPSLDPGGGLQHAFLPDALAARLNELGVLGATASLAGDRSTKVVYVSPKAHGFLGGLSYAVDADDPRFGALAQAGLVHEKYWDSNLLRLGGSASYAKGEDRGGLAVGDLRSLNLGATLILDDDLMLGLSATWNGSSGTVANSTTSNGDAYGITTSVNYNHGRWTSGGYLQWATSAGDTFIPGNDRLAAAEIGLSYRLTTKLRIYTAWYRFEFVDEGGRGAFGRENANSFLLGTRATL